MNIEERYLEAIEEMNELEKQGVLNEKFMIRRAQISLKLGQFEQAKNSYRFLWEKTGLITAADGLARCLIRKSNIKRC